MSSNSLCDSSRAANTCIEELQLRQGNQT